MNPLILLVAASVCNQATEVFSKRSTYDQVFFYSSLVEAANDKMRRKNSAGTRSRGRNNTSVVNPTLVAEITASWKGVSGLSNVRCTSRV